jgi:hypothetical protein
LLSTKYHRKKTLLQILLEMLENKNSHNIYDRRAYVEVEDGPFGCYTAHRALTKDYRITLLRNMENHDTDSVT